MSERRSRGLHRSVAFGPYDGVVKHELSALEGSVPVGNPFDRILASVDDSPPAWAATTLAARVAREYGGSLLLVNSVNWVPLVAEVASSGAVFDPTEIIDGMKLQASELLAQLAELAKTEGIDAERRVIEGRAPEAVPKLADEEGCGVIFTGTHGREGLGRLFLGSTAEGLLRASNIPVLVVRSAAETAPASRPCFERILVAVDDSEPADAAVHKALRIPRTRDTSIVFCSVLDIDGGVAARGFSYAELYSDLMAQTRDTLDRAVERAVGDGTAPETLIVEGSPAEALIATAREQRADLIVIGSHGRRGVRRLFLGSVAESVVRGATTPVMVVRTAAMLPS